ncbi:MAG: universal stress protein [Noviherbaspirillum sp.]|nr:universal stress protein [Noviherbaspirillum sp.]
MSYRTIAVHVNQATSAEQRIRLAAAIALAHNAHLVGAAATAVPIELYLPGALGESDGALSVYIEFLRENARAALKRFAEIARNAGIASVEERIVEDEPGAAMSLQARYSDLTVIGQTNPDESPSDPRIDFPEYVVMNSGRPVMIVPYAGSFDRVGQRVLVAWDASVEATRAIAGAMPILERAELVQVIVFNPKTGFAGHGEQSGADIALFLARHGVKVEVSQQQAGSDLSIGNALLSHAADFGADLLVMGGYGHSRIREVILGGVTHTILASMTVPVLMSH